MLLIYIVNLLTYISYVYFSLILESISGTHISWMVMGSSHSRGRAREHNKNLFSLFFGLV